MTTRQISIGTYRVSEIRLKPMDQPDVIVFQNDDVTNAFRTWDFSDGVLGLARAQLDEREVRVLLEFEDSSDD